MAESLKKLKTSNVISSFIVCSNRNRSALVRELLSNNSLFVGQLYEDKSLTLHARDLIFFTTDPLLVDSKIKLADISYKNFFVIMPYTSMATTLTTLDCGSHNIYHILPFHLISTVESSGFELFNSKFKVFAYS